MIYTEELYEFSGKKHGNYYFEITLSESIIGLTQE